MANAPVLSISASSPATGIRAFHPELVNSQMQILRPTALPTLCRVQYQSTSCRCSLVFLMRSPRVWHLPFDGDQNGDNMEKRRVFPFFFFFPQGQYLFQCHWLDFPDFWLNGRIRDILGIVWKFLGIALFSSEKARLLGCSWVNLLMLSPG